VVLRVKLFQIEEPDGEPADPSGSGAAVGIDMSGAQVEVAISVGGNALVLADREGFERVLPVPGNLAGTAEWQEALEAARIRAERALAHPVTHAVIVLAGATDADVAERLHEAAERAGLGVLRVGADTEFPAGAVPALAAAILAEDLVPRPG
jgi:hypothetical protein